MPIISEVKKQVIAEVVAVSDDSQTVEITITDTAVKCNHCHQRGGCSSLSIYDWFFKQSTIEMRQNPLIPYQKGDELSLSFPDKLMLYSIFYLWGLPLLVFAVGVLSSLWLGEVVAFFLALGLSVLSYYQAKKRLIHQITRQIVIKKVIVESSDFRYKAGLL